MKHHNGCSPHYPEKTPGEATQATTDIPFNNGVVIRTCVDCGQFELVKVAQRAPLVHSYPQWEPPEDDPSAPAEEWREVWYGKMRIVRNRRRARLLKRRGVPLMDFTTCKGRRVIRSWAWFIETRE